MSKRSLLLVVALVFWGTVNDRPAFAGSIAEFRRLYSEFRGFRDADYFHTYGFAGDGRFQAWSTAVHRLARDQALGQTLLERCDLVPGDLWLLAVDHIKRSGSEAVRETTARWDKCFPASASSGRE